VEGGGEFFFFFSREREKRGGEEEEKDEGGRGRWWRSGKGAFVASFSFSTPSPSAIIPKNAFTPDPS
jgi:hypothetical protein